MKNHTVVYNGKKYIIADEFIDGTNRSIDELIAVYSAEKLSFQKLLREGVALEDARDINQKPVKAIAVDDVMSLIKKTLKKEGASEITINKHRNVAASMNRALCELDPETENLFEPTAETTKTFFRDTDRYATTGKHSKTAIRRSEEKEKTEQQESSKEKLDKCIRQLEENTVKKIDAQAEIEKAELTISRALARKKNAENRLRSISKGNIKIIESAQAILKEMTEAETETFKLAA